jgi:hypothetical protein
MKTIWKFPIECVDSQVIEIPHGAKILTAQFQGDKLCLWALVDTEEPKELRNILIYGTGHAMKPDNLRYISTYQVAGGRLIFHVFEEV